MNWSALLVYIIIMSITPGPNNLMSLYLGAKGGLKGSWKFMAGSMSALLIKGIALGLLNLALAEIIPSVVNYLKWAGCIYMLYLAFCMVKSALKKDESQIKEKRGESTVMSGVLLQLLNAKSYLAAISIFSIYVVPYTDSPAAIVLVAALFTLVALACSILWCIAGRAIQRQYEKYKLPVSIVLALSLVWCAWTVIK